MCPLISKQVFPIYHLHRFYTSTTYTRSHKPDSLPAEPLPHSHASWDKIVSHIWICKDKHCWTVVSWDFVVWFLFWWGWGLFGRVVCWRGGLPFVEVGWWEETRKILNGILHLASLCSPEEVEFSRHCYYFKSDSGWVDYSNLCLIYNPTQPPLPRRQRFLPEPKLLPSQDR